MSEQKPPRGSLEWMQGLQKEEEELESNKKNKPPRIDEHLDWEAADREEKVRRASHPAGHKRTGLPKGSPTVGDSSRGKDPGR